MFFFCQKCDDATTSTGFSQIAFFDRMADPQAFRLMFDQQSNVFFFVKDLESRLVVASEPMWMRLGCECEAELVGRLDEDFY